jgi:integrase
MKKKLTKRAVDVLSPRDARYVVWDTETNGFGVRVNRDGTKTFALKYFGGGKQRWLTLGKYGALTVDQARKEARRHLGEVAAGADPVETKKRERVTARAKGITLEEFCVDYMADAYLGKVTYRGRPKKHSTLEIDRGRIDRHIVPLLGRKRVGDVTKDDVEAFKHAVRLGKTKATVRTGPRGVARVRGGETAANRAVGLLGSIMSYAVKLRLREDNPVRGIERIPDKKRQRALLPEEYHSLGQALEVLLEEGANPWAITAFRMLMLTGCRRAEILRLKKEEVDTHHHCFRFGDTKTGQQLRAVGGGAFDVLAEVPVMEESQYVFPASRGNGHIVDVKLFGRACTMAGLKDVTLHSLRHGYASVAGELGYADATISVLLGHAANTISGRYTHIPDPSAVTAADRISETISQRMSGKFDQNAQIIDWPMRGRS